MLTITKKHYYNIFSIIIDKSACWGLSIKDTTFIDVFSERIDNKTFMDGIGMQDVYRQSYKHSYAKQHGFS